MTNLIENLQAFNRKERFFLVGMALGNPTFTVCEGFREKVNSTLNIRIPENAFAAMDYHLDWIYASLFLTFNDSSAQVFSNEHDQITATQEDIDFLIAYQENEKYHLVLLEAKGVLGFTNKQLQSKMERLRDIFDSGEHVNVIPHFALLSPKPPIRIETKYWPSWMLRQDEIPHIILNNIPDDCKRVIRCDGNGNASAVGTKWRVSRK